MLSDVQRSTVEGGNNGVDDGGGGGSGRLDT